MSREKPESHINKNEALPIVEYKSEILEALGTQSSFIVIGETGSGKTTQMPLFLLEQLGPDKKIAMTQPRRLAARTVATHVAKQAGSQVGDTIGYSIRFEDHTTEGTRLTFMTDGILLRKIQKDPYLEEYDVVVIDEAHERSLNIDFSLGLLKKIQERRSHTDKPLQIVITSATLEKEKFQTYFNESPSIEVPGRLHPVDIQYEQTTPQGIRKIIERAGEKVADICKKTDEGDVLIFMPGKMEIEDTIDYISSLRIPNIQVLPLYGEMSPEEQDAIFTPSQERKVIVATNIAETSITIPELRHVIDSGLIRQKEYDPSTGIETLHTRYHAQSGSKQRAGRAGRTAPGTCHRLYTEADFNERFAPYQRPEIQRSNLAHVVLSMKKIGIQDPRAFDFIDKPDEKALSHAIETLTNLGALDESGNITSTGETMAELPLEPHIAKMVLEGKKHNCIEEISTIAAFLGGRSVFVRPKGQEHEADMSHSQFKDSASDFITMLKVWDEYISTEPKKRGQWAFKNFLNAKSLAEIADIRAQLFRVLKQQGIKITTTSDREAIGKTLVAGFTNNLYVRSYMWKYRSAMNTMNPEAGIFPGSSVQTRPQPNLFVSETVTTNANGNTFARNVQVVDPQWIVEAAPHILDKTIEASKAVYDVDTDTSSAPVIYTLKKTRDSILRRQELCDTETSRSAFIQYLIERSVLDHVEEDKKVIQKLDELWRKSGGHIQPVSLQEAYLKKCTEANIHSLETLIEAKDKDIDISLDLSEFIEPELVEAIEKENPNTIYVNGQEIPVTYEYTGYTLEDKKNPDKFKAAIHIPLAEIYRLKELPTLTSKKLEISFTIGGIYRTEKPASLSELISTVDSAHITYEWNVWKRSHPPEYLASFNPQTDEVPPLPSPIAYTTRISDNTDMFAYPGYKMDPWGTAFSIEYFEDKDTAKNHSERALSRIAREKENFIRANEQEKLSLELKAAITMLSSLQTYDTSTQESLLRELSWARNSVTHNQKAVQESIDKALVFMQEQEVLASQTRQELLLQEKLIEKTLKEHYADIENIDPYYINTDVDEYGYEHGRTILSKLETDTGELVAEAVYEDGSVFLEVHKPTKPFTELKFTSYNKILTEKEAKQRAETIKTLQQQSEEERLQHEYEEDLEYAEKEVREGRWKKAKFKKVRHPKTKQETYDYVTNLSGQKITYTVAAGGKQPSSEEDTYYFRTSHQLYSLMGNVGYAVILEKPYPENKPQVENREEPKASATDLAGLASIFEGR